MRIISCHVENYGKLSDLDLNFENGINVICKENGWGKSTFASFIKAMFYGLPGNQKKRIEDNDRKHYMPWQNGAFGGTMRFEVNGKLYEASRSFGRKESDDTFELRDGATNLICNDYSSNLGEELFKLDSESFARTVFISQNDIETSANGSINARIGNVAATENDINKFEAAENNLKDILNSLSPTKATGSVKKRKSEITRIKEAIRNDKDIDKELEAERQKLKAAESEQIKIEKEISKSSDKQKAFNIMQNIVRDHDRYKEALIKRQETMKLAGDKFPKGIPTEDEIISAHKNISSVSSIKARGSVYKFDDHAKDTLASLKSKYAEETPSDEDIQANIHSEDMAVKTMAKLSGRIMSDEDKAEYHRLAKLYESERSGEKDINDKYSSIKFRRNAQDADMAEALASVKPEGNKKLLFAGNIFLFIGLLLAVYNIFWIIRGKMVLPYIYYGLLAGGAVLVLIGVFLKTKVIKSNKISEENAARLKKFTEDRKYIEQGENELKEYVEAYGREYSWDNADSLINDIAKDRIKYQILKDKYINSCSDEDLKEVEDQKAAVGAFLSKWGMNNSEKNNMEKLYDLRNELEEYKKLLDKEKNSCRIDAELNDAATKQHEFFEKYGFEIPADPLQGLENIKKSLNKLVNAKNEYEAADKEMQSFIAKHPMEEVEEARQCTSDIEDDHFRQELEALNDKHREINEQIISIINNINDLTQRYEELENNRSELDNLNELQSIEQTKFKRLEITKDYLIKAKNAFTAKYTEPIRQNFGKYYEVISGRPLSEIKVDAETKVTITEHGAQRDTAFLSAGYRDLIGFSLRMALADAMYKDEKPVIVMDDPFANLDDEKILKGKEVLDRIGEEYQVIYLTCSEKR